MIIKSSETEPGVFLLVSDQRHAESAERDFMDWADFRGCYTPTASEMEEDADGRWTVRVMKAPAE